MKFKSFYELLHFRALNDPESAALKYDGGNGFAVMTYRTLFDEVMARSREIKSLGKSSLGVLCDGSLNCVKEILAANIAGLQITLLDSALPDKSLAQLIPYADIDCLWGEPIRCAQLSRFLTPGVSDGSDKLLFSTSGTSSASKAVVLTGKSLCSSAWCGNEKQPLCREDTVLCMLPLAHVFGFVCGLLWGLSAGASVALGRGQRHYFDDPSFFHPTVLPAVPLMTGFLLQHKLLNPELRLILIGAGDCPDEVLNGISALGIGLSFGYGLTETSSGVALSVSGDPRAMQLCPGVQLDIADDGEILICAEDCMMLGYYKDPEGSAAALDGKWLHSGDLGRMENGRLYITGRKKDIIVLTDGTKIFLPEYEKKLRKLLGEKEFAVAMKDGKLTLFVSGSENELPAIKESLKPLMRTLPRGQQIEKTVFSSEPLPRTSTGKIRRYAL